MQYYSFIERYKLFKIHILSILKLPLVIFSSFCLNFSSQSTSDFLPLIPGQAELASSTSFSKISFFFWLQASNNGKSLQLNRDD